MCTANWDPAPYLYRFDILDHLFKSCAAKMRKYPLVHGNKTRHDDIAKSNLGVKEKNRTKHESNYPKQ